MDFGDFGVVGLMDWFYENSWLRKKYNKCKWDKMVLDNLYVSKFNDLMYFYNRMMYECIMSLE